MQPESKACTCCHVEKPHAEFNRRDATHLENRCRACAAQYRRDHRVRLAAYKAAYDLAHREHLAAYGVAYYRSHRESAAVYQASHRVRRKVNAAAYHQAHREQILARSAVWGRTHPERRREKDHRRRAAKRNGFVERVDVHVLYERDRGTCGICGKHVTLRHASIDHVLPLSKGGAHSYANTRIAHLRCNIRRGNRGAAQLRFIG